jgi:phage terminase large subunit-like protein
MPVTTRDIGSRAVAGLSGDEVERLFYDFALTARPEQLPPGGDWTTWLLIGGRGSGKTRAGAEWIRSLATASEPISPIALVGETMAEAIAVMVKGESGLFAVHPPHQRPKLSGTTLTWPSGAVATVLSASDPDRFRGPQFAAAWCDEVAKWPDPEAAWDMLQFGLRLGPRPRQLATTTPRPTPLLKRLLADPQAVVTKMKTAENRRHLAPAFLEAVVARYRDSVLGRQELDGELIEDRPDALWRRESFCRPEPGSATGRIVVAVDPAVSSGKRSDACGIVVAARLGEGALVLEDATLRPVPPMAWARRVVAAYRAHGADLVVAEVNQGGELVRQMIAQIDPSVPVKAVHASRGKWLRAEPVAALYARGLVRHAPGLSALEDEMCAFGVDGLSDGRSPDRVDALVWALSELLLDAVRPKVRVF